MTGAKDIDWAGETIEKSRQSFIKYADKEIISDKEIPCKGCGKKVVWNFNGWGWCCVSQWKKKDYVFKKIIKSVIVTLYIQLLLVWISFALIVNIANIIPIILDMPFLIYSLMVITALAGYVIGFEAQDRLFWR